MTNKKIIMMEEILVTGIKRKILEDDFNEMRTKVNALMNDDYQMFCMALMSIETFNDDIKTLQKAYDKYISNTNETLLNERIIGDTL